MYWLLPLHISSSNSCGSIIDSWTMQYYNITSTSIMYSTISTISLHSVQYTTYNTHSVQHTTYNTHSVQYTTHNTHSVQYTTHNTHSVQNLKELAIAFQPSLCDIHCSQHITSLLPLYVTLCTSNSWSFANCNYASMCSIMQSTKISITRYVISLASEIGTDTEQYCAIPTVAPVQYNYTSYICLLAWLSILCNPHRSWWLT